MVTSQPLLQLPLELLTAQDNDQTQLIEAKPRRQRQQDYCLDGVIRAQGENVRWGAIACRVCGAVPQWL